jgi:predicted extracellular nuclease
MEIENDGYGANSAIQDLVNGLNDAAGAGTFAFVNPGVAQIGADEIAVGFIYRPARATPVGAPAILDSSVDPRFLDSKNRPTLIQTFEALATGERLTLAVNHLKSKGSDCDDVGDPDAGDGQGNCNGTRTAAAEALVDWLATDPTGSGDPDFMIIGDLNAYALEDPVTAIKSAGYEDLVARLDPHDAYGYVFGGQAGYLDHALATVGLAARVVGVAVWHINADEPRALDYNEEFNPAYLYSPDAYRSSDHDPVLVRIGQVRRVYLPVILNGP